MTIDDLKIDPKFHDLIPKLTDAENKQLEENILADGRVKEPIVVWGNTIVDGHHRYYILKDHPEIPYEIEQKEFVNEYAAMAWACANQLGRRNLSQENKWYLRGKRQESESMAQGGDRKSEDTKSKSYNTTLIGRTDMASKIAEDEHVNRDTIFRDEQYAKGIDIAEEIAPGMRDTLMHGNLKVPKYLLEKIPKVTPDKQRKAVIALSEGNINAAREALEMKKSKSELESEPEPYNANDLEGEIEAAASELHFALNQTLIVMHQDVLANKECRDKVKECLQEIVTDVQEFILKISKQED